MVYYFKARGGPPPSTADEQQKLVTIFMGKDKFENEDLIKYGLPNDVWFHVDKMSSAHVYIRYAVGRERGRRGKAVLFIHHHHHHCKPTLDRVE